MQNPIRKIKEEKGFTYQELCSLAGVSQSTVYKHLSGSKKSISDKILTVIKAMNYDPEQVKREYQEFRENRQKELLSR